MEGRCQLHLGDCLEIMRALPGDSVSSIITDPPYGISFMGQKWDYDVPQVDIWKEALRVLKPGGHLLAFASTRTQHRMAVRIEDAGFEIRDMIAWVYGSGMPKSHNLKGDHKGWGTGLKPALEPITFARKPFRGTVANNVQAHGVGALNIDACRVKPAGESRERIGEESRERRYTDRGSTNFATKPSIRGGDPAGRWPANLIHDGSCEVREAFPDAPGQQGDLVGHKGSRQSPNGVFGKMGPAHDHKARIEQDTSAARFFYCAKATKKDRGAGNTHPSVKPVGLMAYLCRLVTPVGGVILDPFMGSGSTGKAAILEGFRFIGCELSPEYFEMAKRRIAYELSEKLLAKA